MNLYRFVHHSSRNRHKSQTRGFICVTKRPMRPGDIGLYRREGWLPTTAPSYMGLVSKQVIIAKGTENGLFSDSHKTIWQRSTDVIPKSVFPLRLCLHSIEIDNISCLTHINISSEIRPDVATTRIRLQVCMSVCTPSLILSSLKLMKG